MTAPLLDVATVVGDAVAAAAAAGFPTVAAGQATVVHTPGMVVVAAPSAAWPDGMAVTVDGSVSDPVWSVPVWLLAGSGDRAHLDDVYQGVSPLLTALAAAGFHPAAIEPTVYAADTPAYLLTVYY